MVLFQVSQILEESVLAICRIRRCNLLFLFSHHGHIEARSYNQKDVFQSAVLFAQTEGIVPAPESSHAIKGAIDEAIAAREEGKSRTILFSLSGHGFLDLGAYDNYLAGKLVDAPCPEDELTENRKCLPCI